MYHSAPTLPEPETLPSPPTTKTRCFLQGDPADENSSISPSRIGYVGRDLFHNRTGSSPRTRSRSLGTAADAQVDIPPQNADCGSNPVWPTPVPLAVKGVLVALPGTPGMYTSPGSTLFSEAQKAPAVAPTPAGCSSRDGRKRPRHSGGDSRGKRCRAKGCATPPSYSVDGCKPAVVCGYHRRDGMYRVQHDCKTCGQKGCGLPAEVGHMSQNGKIDRFCSRHKIPEVVTTRTKHCKHPRCSNIPTYGSRDGHLSFCQMHKRTGMFTNSNGKLLVATRDGGAFKPEADFPPSGDSITISVPIRGSKNSLQAAIYDPGDWNHPSSYQALATLQSSTEKVTPLTWKLCKVPGCLVQPSYGISGTSRPLFCTGHKKQGMVGVKNRPCVFPGCDTRPHYGISGARPLYCAAHKKKSMVHLLRETLRQQKEDAERKRTAFLERRPADSPSSGAALPIADALSVGRGHASKGGDEYYDNQDQKGHGKGHNRTSATYELARENDAVESAKSVRIQEAAGVRQRQQRPYNKSIKTKLPSRPIPKLPPKSLKGLTLVNFKNRERSKGNREAPTKAISSTATAAPSSAVMPPSSRMADTSGMSPSVEISLLMQARASAKAEVESSGSGRRPRAPSRKALEASGILKNNSAQWMTKEIREADARLKKELREQRKQLKAAGLKRGVVLETYVVSVEETEKSALGSSSGGGDSGVSGDSGASGDSGGSGGGRGKGEMLSAITDRHKPDPIESSTQAEQQQLVAKEAGYHGQQDSSETVVVGTFKAAAVQLDMDNLAHAGKTSAQGVTDAFGSTAVREKKDYQGLSSAKRKRKDAALEANVRSSTSTEKESSTSLMVASDAEHQEGANVNAKKGNLRTREMRSTCSKSYVRDTTRRKAKESGDTNKRPRRGRSEGRSGGTPGGRADVSTDAVCEFEGCRKMAIYGVDGTARYCKHHYIIGMGEVSKSE